MPDDLILKETARWLRYAQEDLEAAHALRARTPRHSCLLAQQSAEKAIKSIYVFLDLRIPRSHDLDMLSNSLPEGWEVKTRFDDLSELSFWAVESRYPGDAPEASGEDADTALILATEVLSCVQKNVRSRGLAL